jgi:hypothetical protein
MRLSWNEIRVRASAFAEKWADAGNENSDTQTFYNQFFEVFGLRRESVGVYEERIKNIKGNTGFIDLFWPGTLIVEQKSAGRDLVKAEKQAFDYILQIKERDRPRYVLVSDFKVFQLRDLATRETLEFALEDLHKHVQKFGFMIGVERREFKDQDPVNIKAAELVGRLHDALEESGFEGRALEVFLVQIVFCLFSDDTGVFQPKDLFLRFLEDRTSEDGSDLGPKLAQLFQTLDTPESKRSKNLDEDLAAFPYINGRLFERQTRIPSFDSDMREKLIEASRFDWAPISPAIFGALFQSVMDSKERRKKGAHYTTEKNILKVIGPLFMDGLRDELEKAKALKRGRGGALDALQAKLSKLTFFDPACGCGNFLIIAYRELRLLEIEILQAKQGKRQLELDANILSKIDVDQFYGIELEEFPARIAETAMWMMDHIMNNALSLAFGQNYARIPLDKAANILGGPEKGDALEVDWEDLLPAVECSYVFGNPPFIGAKQQSDFQRQQVRRIAALGKSGGTLDYVCAWFIKAGEYVNKGGKNPPHIAFVSTNSITQGEQVAQLWPVLFQRFNLEISFAHRTFEWGSDAKGKAHVHCVIVGLSHRVNQPELKRLFSYDNVKGDAEETQFKHLSPYLFDASALKDRYMIITSSSKPMSGEKIKVGTKPIDGGYYIFDTIAEAKLAFADWDEVKGLVRPYIGSKEHMSGKPRYIFLAPLASPVQIRNSKGVKELIDNVREYRLGKISNKSDTKAAPFEPGISSLSLAEFPAKFHIEVIPKNSFMVIPETGSDSRVYAPLGFYEPPMIPSNLVKIKPHANIWEFSILMSLSHMSWFRYIGGRMKNDPRYSIGMVYNTFPWPEIDANGIEILTKTGQTILDARAAHPDATLADLYDPDAMPANLRKAHIANDKAVDRLYRKKPFESERERVEHLFMLYEQLQSPILAAAKPKPRKRKTRTVKTS